MPDARCTRGRVCSKSTRVSNQGYTATTGIPCTMVLTVSFVLFPVTIAWLPPSPVRRRKRLHDLSACVGAPEPHDFAVRCSIIRPRKKLRLTLPRPSHPAPNVRDDRDTPLLWAGTRETVSLIWVKREAEYFCAKGWTAFRMRRFFCPSGKSPECRTANICLSLVIARSAATKIPWGVDSDQV